MPRGKLTYIAFRLSTLETMEEIQTCRDLGEDLDTAEGFLSQVPILRGVAVHVQIDLLAETWSRQRLKKPIEANLLDAAIVYAACNTAARIIEADPEMAELYVKEGRAHSDPQ